MTEQEKKAFDATVNAFKKSFIGNMGTGVHAMSEKECEEWHKKHSRIDPKTGNTIISSEEIG